MSWEWYKQKDRLLNRQFPSGSIFFTFLPVWPKMCEISSDFGFLEGFNTSGGMGSSGKSPIFMYAELVCNSCSDAGRYMRVWYVTWQYKYSMHLLLWVHYSKVYGINRTSILFNLPDFDLTQQLPQDLMQVLLEGIFPLRMEQLLDYVVQILSVWHWLISIAA